MITKKKKTITKNMNHSQTCRDSMERNFTLRVVVDQGEGDSYNNKKTKNNDNTSTNIYIYRIVGID